MTPEDRDNFAWFTQRLAEISTGLAQPASKNLGRFMLETLRMEHAASYTGEIERRKMLAQDAAAAAAKRLAVEGPKLWGELHTRALLPVKDEGAEMTFLLKLRGRLPCGECKTFFDGYMATMPPDYRNYFAWTVALHNAVNAKLGKPMLDVLAARARWA